MSDPTIRCEDCGEAIDPDTCWCGSPMEEHGDDHAPLEMGCECRRDKGEAPMTDAKCVDPIEWHDDSVSEVTPSLKRRAWWEAMPAEAREGFLYGRVRFGGLSWQHRFATASRSAREAAEAVVAERAKVVDLVACLRDLRTRNQQLSFEEVGRLIAEALADIDKEATQ